MHVSFIDLLIYSSFWAQIEKKLYNCKRNQYNHFKGEERTQGRLRNDAHLGPELPRNNYDCYKWQ